MGRFLCQNISKKYDIPMRYSLAKLNMCLLQIIHFYPFLSEQEQVFNTIQLLEYNHQTVCLCHSLFLTATTNYNWMPRSLNKYHTLLVEIPFYKTLRRFTNIIINLFWSLNQRISYSFHIQTIQRSNG